MTAGAPVHAPGRATGGGRELFVYYRVAAASAYGAQAAVETLQAALREAHPGLEARLLRRRSDGPAGDAETWMETYARPASPGGVDAALQRAIEKGAATALAAWVDGARHGEAFEAAFGGDRP